MRTTLIPLLLLLGACGGSTDADDSVTGGTTAEAEGDSAEATATDGSDDAEAASTDGSADAEATATDGSADAAEEDVMQTLLGRCQTFCNRVAKCPVTEECDCVGDECWCVDDVDGAECTIDCFEDTAQRFSGHGEECLALGLSLFDCVDTLSCDDVFSGTNPCQPLLTEAETSGICGTPDDPPSVRPPPAADGTVVCSGGGEGATGSGPAPGGGTASETCMRSFDSCSDGHSYSIECTVTNGQNAVCTCSVDGAATRTITLAQQTCMPSNDEILPRCGWPQLAY